MRRLLFLRNVHVFVEPAVNELFDPATTEEKDLIEFLEGAQSGSRLSCQLIVSAACDGIRITVPGTNG